MKKYMHLELVALNTVYRGRDNLIGAMLIFFYSIIIQWCKQEVFINIAKYSVNYLHEVKIVIGD